MPHPVFAQVKRTVLLVVAASGVITVLRRVLAKPSPQPAAAAAPDLARESPGLAEVPEVHEQHTDAPSPASIAKNVPHQRPVAKPADLRPSMPDDSPGGKLPPRR